MAPLPDLTCGTIGRLEGGRLADLRELGMVAARPSPDLQRLIIRKLFCV